MKKEPEVVKTADQLYHTFNIYGTVEEPLFLAKDVVKWMEYPEVNIMLGLVDEDEKVRGKVLTTDGIQEAWFLIEDGLYEVMMVSNKLVSKLFKFEIKRILRELWTKGITATPRTIDRIVADPEFGTQLLERLKSNREKGNESKVN